MTDKPTPTQEEIDWALRQKAGELMYAHGFRGMTEQNGALQDAIMSLLATVRAEGKAEGAREEREAVVRWLREGNNWGDGSGGIERGDHLPKGE